MKELVEYIVKELVDNKDDVSVTESIDGLVKVLKVTVNSQDLGKVIGKNGRIATSIRVIVRSLSARNKERYVVKIGDKE